MAAKRVAIIGGSPMWRRGVAAVLADGGYTTVETDVIAEWTPGRGVTAAVAHLQTEEDLAALGDLIELYSHLPVVAVTPSLGVAEFAAAIKAGASSAVSEDDPTDALIATLDHALIGRSSVPPTILQALALRVAVGFGEMLKIDEPDQDRLRSLARGTTVAQLAEDNGFSEREMFRILNDLYAAIGVRNRTEAIIWASRYGVLDDAPAASE